MVQHVRTYFFGWDERDEAKHPEDFIGCTHYDDDFCGERPADYNERIPIIRAEQRARTLQQEECRKKLIAAEECAKKVIMVPVIAGGILGCICIRKVYNLRKWYMFK